MDTHQNSRHTESASKKQRVPPLLLRDSTLREGLESPIVTIRPHALAEIAVLLSSLGIKAIELAGPGDISHALSLLPRIQSLQDLATSAIVNVTSPNRRQRMNELGNAAIDEVDLLLHVSPLRLIGPSCVNSSLPPVERLKEAFSSSKDEADAAGIERVGVGLGDVFRADPDYVGSLIESLCALSPCRFILYDTVGIALPSQVAALVGQLVSLCAIPFHVHFHNDLGMAAANTVAAIEKGAAGADVTIGGIGDRCGNAPMEVVALVAERHLGIPTGIHCSQLTGICGRIFQLLTIDVSPCAPVIGRAAFCHSASSHFAEILQGHPEAYEPYPPESVGQSRHFLPDGSQELEEALRARLRRHAKSRCTGPKSKLVTEAELEKLLE